MTQDPYVPAFRYIMKVSFFLLFLTLFSFTYSLSAPQAEKGDTISGKMAVSAPDLINGEFLIRRGRTKEAIDYYYALTKLPTNDERKGFVFLRLARIYYALGEYEDAYKNVESAVTLLKGRFNLYSAMFLRMKVLIELGWFKEARQIAGYLIDSGYVGASKADIYLFMAETDIWLEDFIGSIGEYENAYLSSDLGGRTEIFRSAFIGLSRIMGKIKDPFIFHDALLKAKTLKFRSFISYLGGKVCLEIGFYGFARLFIDSYLELSRFTGEEEKGRQLSYELKRKKEGLPVIDVYLPFRGAYQDLGYRTLAGLELSLRKEKSETVKLQDPFFIDVHDTWGNNLLLSNDMEDGKIEENVVAIVGPLTGREAYFVEPGEDTPLIFYLGQREKKGGRGFINFGLKPDQEAKKLMSFAYASGVRKPLILYPKNGYGEAYLEAVRGELEKFSLVSFREMEYQPETEDFTSILKDVVGSRKFDEYADVEERGIYMPVPFDGVFILDFPARGYLILTQMIFNNIRVPTFTLSSWVDLKFLREKGSELKGLAMVTDFNPFVSLVELRDFLKEFGRTFTVEPDRFAGYGYDLGMILRSLVSKTSYDAASFVEMRDMIKDKIFEIDNYEGVTGEFLITPDKGVIRILTAIGAGRGKVGNVPLEIY